MRRIGLGVWNALVPVGLNVQPSEFNPSVAKEPICDRRQAQESICGRTAVHCGADVSVHFTWVASVNPVEANFGSEIIALQITLSNAKCILLRK